MCKYQSRKCFLEDSILCIHIFLQRFSAVLALIKHGHGFGGQVQDWTKMASQGRTMVPRGVIYIPTCKLEKSRIG